MDFIMKNIVMITIFLIYFIATIRGIFRVIFYKVGNKLPAYENLNESISEDKIDLYIKILVTSTNQNPDPISFDTDDVPFIIHNSATGAIFNNRF